MLSQVLQTIRFICYYILPYETSNPVAYCCLIELLKGASYSLIHTSAVQLASKFAPSHLKTISILFYNAIFVAIGTVASGVYFMNYFKKGKGEDVDVEIAYNEFHSAFYANIIFSLLSLGFFIAKYALFENLLFSRENTQKKLEAIEQEAIKNEAQGSMPEQVEAN